MKYSLLILALLTSTTLADTWTVDDDGKADFDNIQAAVDAASDGDVIQIFPGLYSESVEIIDKALVIQKAINSKAGNVIIDGCGLDTETIIYVGPNNHGTTISGITVQNSPGRGLWIENCNDVSVSDCTIQNNSSGGIVCSPGDNTFISNCKILNNTGGNGIAIKYGRIDSCLIEGNIQGSSGSYGGGIRVDSGNITVTNSIIANNHFGGGGGISMYGSTINVVNSTLVDNSCGAIRINGGSFEIENSILWGNDNMVCGGTTAFINNSCLQESWAGLNNIVANPSFINTTWYTIDEDSPCTNAGSNASAEKFDLFTDYCGSPRYVNNIVDMGAWEFQTIDLDGACCIAGSCFDITIEECVTDNGSWLGCKSNCDSILCQPPPILTVDDDGNADFDNIQAAVNAACGGYEIVVMPGTYTSTQDGHVVNMLGKAVTLRSSNPSDPDVVAATIINGENNKRGIVFFNGETDETIVNGLTITNCAEVDFDFDGDGEIDYWEKYGGGIYCMSNPTILNCVVSNNSALYGECGAGMFCRSSRPTLINCNFNNNDCSLRGGAIALLWDGNATFKNCIVESNNSTHGGGGMYIAYSSAMIENCVIRFNSYGGIYTISSTPSDNPTIMDSSGCDNVGYHVYGDYIDGGGNQWASNCSDIDQDGDGVPDNLDNCYLYNPDQADCNNNEIGDVCDIADGISEDINSDSIPDECQCLSDANGDGYVNVTDLLAVIDQWGLTDSPADVTSDGIVNVSDLLLIISNWGPCN